MQFTAVCIKIMFLFRKQLDETDSVNTCSVGFFTLLELSVVQPYTCIMKHPHPILIFKDIFPMGWIKLEQRQTQQQVCFGVKPNEKAEPNHF